MFLCSVPSQKNGDKRDENRAQPRSRYHSHGGVGVHEVVIVKRFYNSVEPIKGYSTEVEGADGAGVHINRVPKVANSRTENPPGKTK